MRTTTALVLTTLLVAGSAAALPLSLPTCGVPALSLLCVGVVVGDIVVGPMQPTSEEEFNNGTYVLQGTVTVEDGGRVEIILSTVAFGEAPQPIHVHAGGTLVIEDSTLAAGPDGTMPVILVEDGGTVVVTGSDFTAITLEIRTDDAALGDTGAYNTYALGAPALRLQGFEGTVSGSKFTLNEVAIEVVGGTVSLEDLDFTEDAVGIDVADATLDAERINMADMTETGIRMIRSAGTLSSMFIADRAGPPTVGLDLQDTTATIHVLDNEIFQWGTGMFTCNADVVLSGNVFHDNLQDFGSC